jgi:hypothetical protein
VRRSGAFILATIGSCVAVSPFLLIDFQTLISDLSVEARPFHLGATGHGFVGNVGWYLAHPLQTALGASGLILAAVGMVVATRARPVFGYVVGTTIVAFLVSISVQHLVWERWVVPLLPLLTIATAYVAVRLVEETGRRIPVMMIPAAIVMAVLSTSSPLHSAEEQAAERAVDTRRLASAWARTHIPPGSVVGIEYLAFDILSAPWRFLYPAGDHGCVDVRASLTGQLTVSKVDRWRRARPIVDFGGIGPMEAAGCRADYLILINYDRYLAEASTFPEEVANYRRMMAGGRTIAKFVPRHGAVGGPVVRIVRLPARVS